MIIAPTTPDLGDIIKKKNFNMSIRLFIMIVGILDNSKDIFIYFD